MDENLKKEIIMEHYQHPINNSIPENIDGYIKVNTLNGSCIDNIDIYLKVVNNIIEDIKFSGNACAISTASTSIMIENLIGKTISEAKDFVDNFNNMINEDNYNDILLNDAICFSDIYKQSNRKSCATLPYRGIIDAINKL